MDKIYIEENLRSLIANKARILDKIEKEFQRLDSFTSENKLPNRITKEDWIISQYNQFTKEAQELLKTKYPIRASIEKIERAIQESPEGYLQFRNYCFVMGSGPAAKSFTIQEALQREGLTKRLLQLIENAEKDTFKKLAESIQISNKPKNPTITIDGLLRYYQEVPMGNTSQTQFHTEFYQPTVHSINREFILFIYEFCEHLETGIPIPFNNPTIPKPLSQPKYKAKKDIFFAAKETPLNKGIQNLQFFQNGKLRLTTTKKVTKTLLQIQESQGNYIQNEQNSTCT